MPDVIYSYYGYYCLSVGHWGGATKPLWSQQPPATWRFAIQFLQAGGDDAHKKGED